MRDLALAYPDQDTAWRLGNAYAVNAARYEFMFGDDILVAPVVQENKRNRDVWLPPGQWVNFWQATTYNDATGSYDAKPGQSVIEGGRVIHDDAPLGQIPLFVKAGTCITMLPPDVQTLTNASGFAHDNQTVTLAEGINRTRKIGYGRTC